MTSLYISNMQGFLEELKWRGMIHDMTPGIENHLSVPRNGYIGFDPTAPSLGIGNYVQIMLLKFFQNAGHTPILLMGGATGRIGDPSGKREERTLKSYEELDFNLNAQLNQAKKFLSFEGENAAVVVNNLDFYKSMNVIDFLRDVGKHLTISYMLSKDSVKKRLESGLSFTEFSYQLLQANDYLMLNQQYNCTVQMGGSDQWGNITSGTEFIRRSASNEKAYAVTTPLLTKSDGSKFGKTEKGNLWLDPAMTTPYQFYQFWINSDDADIPKFLRYFSLKNREEILEMEAQNDLQQLKRTLAREITSRVHSDEDFEAVLSVSELLFGRSIKEDNIGSLSPEVWKMVSGEVPSYVISKAILSKNLDDILTEHAAVFGSKGDFRRAIKGNALAINKKKIKDVHHTLHADDVLAGGYILVENGKKNKVMLRLSND